MKMYLVVIFSIDRKWIKSITILDVDLGLVQLVVHFIGNHSAPKTIKTVQYGCLQTMPLEYIFMSRRYQ